MELNEVKYSVHHIEDTTIFDNARGIVSVRRVFFSLENVGVYSVDVMLDSYTPERADESIRKRAKEIYDTLALGG